MVSRKLFIFLFLSFLGGSSLFSMKPKERNRQNSKRESTEIRGNSPQTYKQDNTSHPVFSHLINELGDQKFTHNYIQLKVSNQFNSLDGGTLCGYHALKNGFLIARLYLDESQQKTEIEKLLVSQEIINTLFKDASSAWRSHIIKQRAANLAMLFIRDALLKQIKGAKLGLQGTYELNLEPLKVTLEQLNGNSADKEVERSRLQDMLSSVAQRLAQASSSYQNSIGTYNLTKDVIIQAFKEQLTKNSRADNKILHEILNHNEKIEQYFPSLASLSFSIIGDSIVNIPSKGNAYQKGYGPGQSKNQMMTNQTPGEWLESQEILSLAELEKSHNFVSFQDACDASEIPFYGVFCIESSSHNPLNQQFKTNSKLQLLTTNMQNPLSSFVAIMIIHQANVAHWFTCVIRKHQFTIDYTFTDSAGNLARLNDPFALKVIKLLNGQQIDEQLPNVRSQTETASFTNSQTFQEQTIPTPASEPSEAFIKILASQMQDKAINYCVGIPQTTLEDLVGVPQEIARTVQALSNPRPHNRRYGMLLYGPPGTGKTALAEAIAGTTKRELFKVYASNIVSKFQGSGAQTIKEVFCQAEKAQKPVIVFIDELDLITGKADAGNGNARSYEEARVALQAELDKKNPHIFFIAATNHLDNIDPTIRDRLDDYTVKIDLPTRDQRKQIFVLHARKNNIKIDEDLLNKLADLSTELSGRQIEKIMLKAIDLADTRNSENLQVTEQDIYKAFYLHDERVPHQQEREVMLRHFIAEKANMDNETYRKLAYETAGLTGRKIEEIIKKALDLASQEKDQKQVTLNHLFIAIHLHNPKILPNKSTRETLISYYLLQYNLSFSTQTTRTELARRTEGLNALQIEKIVIRGIRIAQKQNRVLHAGDLYIAICGKKTNITADRVAAEAILKYCLRNKSHNLSEAFFLKFAYEELFGYNKQFIKKLIDEAMLFASKSYSNNITEKDLIGAVMLHKIEKIVGREKLNIYKNSELIKKALIAYTRGKLLMVGESFLETFATEILGRKQILGQETVDRELSYNIVSAHQLMTDAINPILIEPLCTYASEQQTENRHFTLYHYIQKYTYVLFIKDVEEIIYEAEKAANNRDGCLKEEDLYHALTLLNIKFKEPQTSTKKAESDKSS